MIEKMLDWLSALPLWQATLFLFVVVFFRAQMTYWIGKLIHLGVLKSQWGRKKAENSETLAGIAAIEKYGWPIIPLSFLTVGFQSVVQIGAGLLDMKWSKYTLVAIPGYLVWGFIYASGGLALFRSITQGSIGLFVLFLIIALAVVISGNIFIRYLKHHSNKI